MKKEPASMRRVLILLTEMSGSAYFFGPALVYVKS